MATQEIDLGNVQGQKGDPGPQGPQGEQGPEGPQGPPGEVDADTAIEFTQAASRVNLVSGESIKTLFGKVMKWFADLKAVAFSGNYNDLTNKPSLGSAASQHVANNLTTNAAGSVLDARQGRALDQKISSLNSALDDRTNGKVRIWQDNEGGNIEITSPNGMKWQMDSHNDNDFRLYKDNSGELGPFYTFSGGADKGGNIATETYVQTTLDAEMDNVKVYSDLVGITFTPDGASQEYSWGTYFVPAGYCFLNAVITDNNQLQGKYVGIITQRYNKSNRMVSMFLNWRYSGTWEVLITLGKEKR